MAEVRVRFAPSPTGSLHIGGARTALFNYVFAKSKGGKFILRIDDTDQERSKPEFQTDILAGLSWLGLEADEGPEQGGPYQHYRQSERLPFHLATVERLVEAGVAKKDRDGTTRLSYGTKPIEFQDAICGECKFLPRSLGPDPVLLRADGIPTYHLASVSDDIEMGISHIIRGQDHLTNTAKHVRIFQALGRTLPVFAHLPLILGADGQKLSKRNADALTSLTDFRSAGYLPEAITNFLLLLGWSHPESKEQCTLEDAVATFDLARVSHNAAVFDQARLDFLNGWWIRHLPLENLESRLAPFLGEHQAAVSRRGPKGWREILELLRDGLAKLSEIEQLAAILFAEELELSPQLLEAALAEVPRAQMQLVIKAWLELLQESVTSEGNDCFDEREVAQLLSRVKKLASGVSGKELFKPLRLAVMSTTSGPELKLVLRLISRQILIQRAEYVMQSLA